METKTLDEILKPTGITYGSEEYFTVKQVAEQYAAQEVSKALSDKPEGKTLSEEEILNEWETKRKIYRRMGDHVLQFSCTPEEAAKAICSLTPNSKGGEAVKPKLTVSKMRELEKQVHLGEISYSRMIEIINGINV